MLYQGIGSRRMALNNRLLCGWDESLDIPSEYHAPQADFPVFCVVLGMRQYSFVLRP